MACRSSKTKLYIIRSYNEQIFSSSHRSRQQRRPVYGAPDPEAEQRQHHRQARQDLLALGRLLRPLRNGRTSHRHRLRFGQPGEK